MNEVRVIEGLVEMLETAVTVDAWDLPNHAREYATPSGSDSVVIVGANMIELIVQKLLEYSVVLQEYADGDIIDNPNSY